MKVKQLYLILHKYLLYSQYAPRRNIRIKFKTINFIFTETTVILVSKNQLDLVENDNLLSKVNT